MYDYDDYEEDVLLVLRVLKYLHGVQTREEFLKTLNHCTEAGMDELYELADTFTWELFPAAVFDIDEEWDATTMSFSHPNIDCYLSLTGHTWAQACPSETPGGHRAVFLHGDGLSDRSAVLPYGRIDLRKAAVLSGLLRYAGLCQFHGGSAALSRPGKPAPGEAVPGTAK